MHKQTVLIVGEVFIDTHLDIIDRNGPLVRLGGIFHAARAFSALGIDFALAYYAPDYLEDDINEWALRLGTKGCFKIGSINKAPNIMLINESKEAGDKGYYNILKDQAEYLISDDLGRIVNIINLTDMLIYPGRYNISNHLKTINGFKGKVHIDFHYDFETILQSINRDIETAILSTSSSIFKDCRNGCIENILEYFKGYSVNKFLIKENRGGSFCYVPANKISFESESYYVPTMHSVGVGDVYNSVFISTLYGTDTTKKMRLAALCAAKYAETMSYDKFRQNAKLMIDYGDELCELVGVRLPWAERKEKNIYIAAPDFPNVDTRLLDKLKECLLFHNFSPRFPIRENGVITHETSDEDEIGIYNKDLVLLNECDLLIAILLNNDPGTLVELGMFKHSGKPTVIYDPFGCCNNMFVCHTPDFLCRSIYEVIEATFLCLRRR